MTLAVLAGVAVAVAVLLPSNETWIAAYFSLLLLAQGVMLKRQR